MPVRGIDFPDDLYYDRQHNWGRVEGNVLTQGLSDFGQIVAGDIVFAGLPLALGGRCSAVSTFCRSSQASGSAARPRSA